MNLIFPHQLFSQGPLLTSSEPFVLIEEHLFFHQYKFHKTKLCFHRASMKAYEQFLQKQNKTVQYISAIDKRSDIRVYIESIATKVDSLTCYYPHDNWLQKRLEQACEKHTITLHYKFETPYFITSSPWSNSFFKSSKQKFHQTTFYKQQRKKHRVLITENNKPEGGKWTFDKENRKPYPKQKQAPSIFFPEKNSFVVEAKIYVGKHFANNYGEFRSWFYPINFEDSEQWLQQFFEFRFHEFGHFEDAIVEHELILNHSVLSPLLNVGLLTPKQVLSKAIAFANENNVPINSVEGFVRQILGWREFIFGIYEVKGSKERTTNFWKFSKPMPESFYTAATGIAPVDKTIKKVMGSGYCHHIERLMVLSNFMLLCEINPDEIYKWFMELFIDAYDWVMVPNVYGMAQFADGGLMSTKPYISSSNYIRKMSNYKSGNWEQIWDALFWRFMHVHRSFFESNPRLAMLLSNWDKKSEQDQNKLLNTAERFLQQLHSS